MTVHDNVEWPLKIARTGRARRERVDEVFGLLGITDLAKRYPGEISGGQQKRVPIARTIAPAPNVLLFDEPLSNLDAKLRTEMRTELLRVHRATGASVHVTHDQVEAMTMATRMAVIRGGLVEQFCAPLELLERPASPFVAAFVGTPPATLLAAELFQRRSSACQPQSAFARSGVFDAPAAGSRTDRIAQHVASHAPVHVRPAAEGVDRW
jgi:iron(III) transport system ATP-binding protein